MKTTNGSNLLAHGLTAMVVAAALVLVGCTSDDADTNGNGTETTIGADASSPQSSTTDTTDSSDAPRETTPGADANDGSTDPHQAIGVAIGESPGAAVVEIERDTSDGIDVWEVDLLTADGGGLTVKIAVDDGRIVKQEPTNLDAEQQSAPGVTAAEIITIALDSQPGDLLGVELDTENGVVVWEVKVRSTGGAEVKMFFDPNTGEVVQPG